MSKPLDESVILRLMLAKSFRAKALRAIGTNTDEMALATAIVEVHDCLDNLLGAAISHLEISLPQDKDYLLARHDAVFKKLHLPGYRNEIRKLNTIRNDIKHEGILPNTRQALALIADLKRYIDEVMIKGFGVSLDEVSLKELISDPDSREPIGVIEKLIGAREYKEAMEQIALLMFAKFEHFEISSRLVAALMGDKDDEGPLFIKDRRSLARELKDLGIDPYLYHRVRNLIPEIGLENRESGKPIRKYEDLTWHERNWTKQNALFCLNFLTDLLIRKQKEYSGLFDIQYRKVRHVVIARRDTPLLDKVGGKILETLKAGSSKDCLVDGYYRGSWLAYHASTDDYACISTFRDDGTPFAHFQVFVAKADIDIEEFEAIEGGVSG
jgi:hypothetical protein